MAVVGGGVTVVGGRVVVVAAFVVGASVVGLVVGNGSRVASGAQVASLDGMHINTNTSNHKFVSHHLSVPSP